MVGSTVEKNEYINFFQISAKVASNVGSDQLSGDTVGEVFAVGLTVRAGRPHRRWARHRHRPMSMSACIDSTDSIWTDIDIAASLMWTR